VVRAEGENVSNPNVSNPNPKRSLQKAANVLGYASRTLRDEANALPPEPDVVARLEALGTADAIEREQKADVQAAETRARYKPLIERAERCVADNAAAQREHGALIQRLARIDWGAVRSRARIVPTPGSFDDASTRLAMLNRTVSEAVDLLRGDDTELRDWLRQVKEFTGRETERSREYAVNGLTFTLNGRAGSIRSKAAVIQRLLAAVERDLDALDAAAVAEAVLEAK
jgi:hypothetical protein